MRQANGTPTVSNKCAHWSRRILSVVGATTQKILVVPYQTVTLDLSDLLVTLTQDQSVTIVTPAKLGWIEAYRGIAATAVVLYHVARHFDKNYGLPILESAFRFGHAGVDLFFVMSGFVILFIHFDDIGRPGRLRHYLARRLTRLLPPYWGAVGVTVVMLQLSGHASNLSDIVRAVLPVPISTEPLLGVAWTLQYEFIFYAAFAVLIVNRLAGLTLMAVWLSAIACTAASGWHPGLPSAYWGIFNVEFFAGMAVAYRLRRGGLCRYKVVQWAGIVLFIAAALAEDLGWMDGYTSFARLAYGLASAMLLLGGVEASRRSSAQIPRFLQTLGSASYSLYLFHFIFIGLLWRIWLAVDLDSAISPAIGVAVFAAVAISGGIIVSRLVEHPLTHLIRKGFSFGGSGGRPAVPGPIGQKITVSADQASGIGARHSLPL